MLHPFTLQWGKPSNEVTRLILCHLLQMCIYIYPEQKHKQSVIMVTVVTTELALTSLKPLIIYDGHHSYSLQGFSAQFLLTLT